MQFYKYSLLQHRITTHLEDAPLARDREVVTVMVPLVYHPLNHDIYLEVVQNFLCQGVGSSNQHFVHVPDGITYNL